MRSFQRSPLCRHVPLRPADRSEDLLKRLPTSSRGAARAVSHDFDGFVRRRQCGLVASHYRLWSSPGFLPRNDVSAAARQSPQTLYPSECSPPGKVSTVTVPLLGRSPDAFPLSWLALLPSCTWTEIRLLFERHLHLRGVSKPGVRCSPVVLPPLVRPILPWAFLDFELSLVVPPAMKCTEMLCILFGARPKPGPSRHQTLRRESVVPTNSSSSNLLINALAAEAAVAMMQGLETVHTVLPRAPRCRSIVLALQPSRVHRCRWAL
jgi:hypothetical protein